MAFNDLPEPVRRVIEDTIAEHEATWGLGVQPRLNSDLAADVAAEVFVSEPKFINIHPNFAALAQVIIEDPAFLAQTLADVITHEYGHCLDLSMDDPLALQRKFLEMGGPTTRVLVKSELSGNASSSLTEAIGEAFLRHHQEGDVHNRWAMAAIQTFKEAHSVNWSE